MNLKKELVALKGNTYPMSYPGNLDIEKVKKEKGIEQVTSEELPHETAENVIINCLANYAISDKKEAFLLQSVATFINSSEEQTELPERLKNFLGNQVLPYSTLRRSVDRDGQEQTHGMYASWVIVQIYNILGIEEPKE